MAGYDCEGPEFYNERTQTARKHHKCTACGETIRAGHKYVYISGMWEGDIVVAKRCLRCEAIAQHLLSRSGEGVEINLNCGHSYHDVFDCEPPEEIAALAFMTQEQAQQSFNV